MYNSDAEGCDKNRLLPAPAPEGPIVALATEDLYEREAILAMQRPGFFAVAHFNNYPALLIQLDVAEHGDVCEAIVDAWLSAAPNELAFTYLAADDPRQRMAQDRSPLTGPANRRPER